MEKLIKEVLDRYNTNRKFITNGELAKLITAHIKIGSNSKKGWYLNLNKMDGQHKRERQLIEDYEQTN